MHNDFQDHDSSEPSHNQHQCQWLIVAAKFDLEYDVSSLSRLSDAPWVGHLELARRIFGYLKNYPKMWYAINSQPLTIDVDYETLGTQM